MFSLTDGPTAVRSEMIRALAFSVADVEQCSGSRKETVRGGLAAVWNGRAGQVIVVVRFVERAAVDRYAWTEPIRSESDLEDAIQEGITCAENLGLQMDDNEFLSLGSEKKRERIRRWNQIRKAGHSGGAGRPAAQRPPSGKALPGAGPAALAPNSARPPSAAPAPKTKPAVAERPLGESGVVGRAVLGRVAVVRKTGAASREAIGRILASY